MVHTSAGERDTGEACASDAVGSWHGTGLLKTWLLQRGCAGLPGCGRVQVPRQIPGKDPTSICGGWCPYCHECGMACNARVPPQGLSWQCQEPAPVSALRVFQEAATLLPEPGEGEQAGGLLPAWVLPGQGLGHCARAALLALAPGKEGRSWEIAFF